MKQKMNTKKSNIPNTDPLPEASSQGFNATAEDPLTPLIEDIPDIPADLSALIDHATRINIAINAVKMAWWDMNIKTGEVIFHQRKAEILGFSPDMFHHYQDFMKRVHPEDQQKAMQAMRDHISGKAANYEVDYRIQHADGRYIWFQDAGKITQRDENGKPLKVIGFVVDITKKKEEEAIIKELNAKLEHKVAERTEELVKANDLLKIEIETRKLAEEKSEKARRSAEDAMKSKSEFMSRMSHELRTPLNSILGFAQLLEMGELNEKQKRAVRHILTDGKKLLQLINEVLDITNIESGRLSLSMEAVQVYPALKEILDTHTIIANQKNISISLLPFEKQPPSIVADYQRFNKLISILLDNAIKYNHHDGSILIKVEREASSNKMESCIKISITDTGQGIDISQQSKLFMPFERVNTAQEGTGLGLALARKLTDAMRGNIGFESIPGVGSTFWVRFPETQSENQITYESLFKSGDTNQNSQENAFKIVYFEDNPSSIDLVANVLSVKHPSSRFVAYKSGKNAKELLQMEKPNIILLDLDLPEVNGWELLRIFKQDENLKTIPVIIISANIAPGKQHQLLEAGAEACLPKPLDVSSFLNLIHAFV